MIAPPAMLAAATLLWGWHTGLLPLALPMALALEGWRVTGRRFEVAPAGFQRTADVCTWAFLIGAGYITVDRGLPVPILAIAQWLPVMLLPIVLAQVWSTRGRVALSALFIVLRRQPDSREANTLVDLTVPFVIVCLVAAGSANVRSPAYFAGVAVIALWLVWRVRPRRVPLPAWLALAAAVVAVGHAGHVGLARLQAEIANLAIEWMTADHARIDPYRQTTHLGHIGELKLSQRIVMRVSAEREAGPLLLHRASYDAYVATNWVARDAAFAGIEPGADGRTWQIAATPAAAQQVPERIVVHESFRQPRGVLALPPGAARLEDFAAASVGRNRFGVLVVERTPGPASYQVVVQPEVAAPDGVTDNDLRIPPPEQAAVDQVAARLGLARLEPQAALAAIRLHFLREFRYATFRRAAGEGTPIADFLLRARAGHCEYFATAAVLLARAAGVPARYATGYAVQEWSPFEGAFVVRERHAHAWARVYLNGRWQDFDTTPPVWFEEEARGASPLEPLADGWSWLAWRFERWRAGDRTGAPAWLGWALVPLFAMLAWRVVRAGGFRLRRRAGGPARVIDARPGLDSELYRVEARLATLGLARRPDESHDDWLARIARAPHALDVEALRPLVRLHRRHRFDPHGLGAAERALLAQGVQRWLTTHADLR